MSTEVAIYEGDVSISTCRALALWQPALKDDMRNMIEEKRLEAEAEELFQDIEEIKRGIHEMERTLEAGSSESIKHLTELRNELEDLFAEHMRRQAEAEAASVEDDGAEGPMPTEDELEAMHRRFNEDRNKQMEEQAEADSSSKKSQKVIKLFRKIAKRTHPDKTSDPKMHELFRAARIAYAKNDYESLDMIWRQVSGKVSNLFNAVFSRLKELRELVALRQLEKRRLTTSDPYRMMMDFEDPESRDHVERHYRKLLEEQIKKTLFAIRALDPTRHQPKPTLTGKEFFISNETTTVLNGESEDSPWEEDDGIAA